ncbi:MAG: type VI secretion system tip protein VgrG [Acidobacteria bacterium]|nr:type VI secretion system tip protein VgrG [Acidobacteriota bacterium]
MPDYSQANRPIKVKTPLGEDVLLLERFEGREGISRPFQFHLRMVSIQKNLGIERLLNKSVTLYLQLPDRSYRHINGKVRSARQRELDMGLTTYELEMVPWLWFLRHQSNCRFFLDKTAPEIIQSVLACANGGPVKPRLTRSYQTRAYCVQYRETDFNFASRLMEEEGIFYYWEHTEDTHTMILADSVGGVKPCPHQQNAKFAHQAWSEHPEDFVHTVNLERNYRTGKITLREFDFSKQYDPFVATVSGQKAEAEKYDYPGYRWNGPGMEKMARDLLEMEEWPSHQARGASGCRPFEAGYKFTLEEHFNEELNKSWLLLEVHHKAKGTNYRSEMEEPFHYKNTYAMMPSNVPYRPPRRAAKPTIKGTQTAIVVSDAGGEEIYVDKHGRVKVRFPWDRENKNSCWVRVSHAWAGLNWGWMTVPRVGQEVVVSFMEGDPDRPLITGRVYDEMQPPPYKLPDKKTVSTLKSKSSMGGGASNYNEIRIEDLKGSEQLFIHSEKQRDERTKEEMREWVGMNRHLIVKQGQVEQIGADKELHVKANQKEKIDSKCSLTVGTEYHTKVGTNYALDAGMEVHIKGGMKVVVEAGMEATLKGPGGFVKVDPSGVYINGIMVMINSGGSPGSGSGASPDAPKDPDQADDGSKFTKM